MNLWKAYALALRNYHLVSLDSIAAACKIIGSTSELRKKVLEAENKVATAKQALLDAGENFEEDEK